MTHLDLQNCFNFSGLGSKFSQELKIITEVATSQLISYLQELNPVFKKNESSKAKVINPYQNSTFQAVKIASCI